MGKSANASHRKPRFACGYVLLTSVFLSCGSGDHVQVPPPEEPGESPADIGSGVNVCPVFGGSLVMPKRIAPGESSTIAVRVVDPDAPDSQLVFAWSAPSGSFSKSDAPLTTYSCSQVGQVELTVTAKDAVGCVSDLRIDVECMAN